MAVLHIRDVPANVAAALRQCAADKQQTSSVVVACELERIISRPGNDKVVDRFRNRARAANVTTARIVEEVQRGRR